MAAAAELKQYGPEIHLACVEGEPEVTPLIESFRNEEVLLIPFMLVAGDHALNDLAGDDPESWKSRLEKRGCSCSSILHGLGELPSVAEYFAASLPGR